jgi:hypothetical protein
MKTRLMKPIMASSLFAGTLVSLVAAAMTFSTSGVARAQTPEETCGVHTLRGLYLFAAHGWNIAGGVAVPKAIVEGIDFNGEGALVTPFATVSINGHIIQVSGTPGIYIVEANCTGTLTFNDAAHTSFNIFVDPRGGKQLWMIQTGPAIPGSPQTGPVFEGTATRVSN